MGVRHISGEETGLAAVRGLVENDWALVVALNVLFLAWKGVVEMKLRYLRPHLPIQAEGLITAFMTAA